MLMMQQELADSWHLEFGAKSCTYIACHGYQDAPELRGDWKRTDVFKCLGQLLQSSGSIDACFRESIDTMWRKFHMIMSPKYRSETLRRRRIVLLNWCVLPIFLSRCSSYPFTRTRAEMINYTQLQMCIKVYALP